ncbi:MAG: ABC transporter substrate-binding protein [Candidatus Rokubacteria bacterium]|nr:ABC transporter substrate-binding protein [Candidatus Rokubacteria bacterium]MBI3827616.1 ABC transporter substrate-binding protein [Candidatus Rokubacteria bacterium]
MTARTIVVAALTLLVAAGPLLAPARAQDKSVFIPLLVYRTGPYAPNGIPSANGFNDYFNLVNERDGGVNGVKIAWEECETQYDTKQGVECYERLKAKSPVLVNPFSTGITYQLIPKAPQDKVVIHSAGYGMTASADGRWFPWVFNVPMTYWSQASAFVKYVGQQEGGLEKLKGKKIVHVFHNSPYGKEANPTLEELAKKYGFELTLLAVDHPGQEQKSTWLQVRRINPSWIYISGWGVMNQVAVKEAAAIGFAMDHVVGNWWTGTESDVVPAGEGAKGYKSMTFHAPGHGFKVHQDILKYVYEKGKGATKKEAVGEVLYNRTLINAMLDVEAIRTAMTKFGNKPMTGEQVRWGMENLNVTEKRLDELGMKGMTRPLKVTCENHEGNGLALVQQWDGKQWKIVSDWIEPMRDVVRPKLEEAAVVEGKKLSYEMRDCAKEK